jgi:hypothetical protein
MTKEEKLKILKTILAEWDSVDWETWLSTKITHKPENVEIYKLKTLAK